MIDFKTTEERVVYVLENYPVTRKSDNHLILAVYTLIDRDIIRLPFLDVLKMASKDKKFPSFETIRRSRQKVQASREELKDSDTARVREGIMQESFKEYALS